MRRECAVCGQGFDAKRAAATYCGDTCRKRAQRSGEKPAPSSGGRTFAAVLAQLEKAERVGSPRGAMALALAQRIDETPGSGAAALVKELRVTLDEALDGALVVADEMDELKARRDLKRNAG